MSEVDDFLEHHGIKGMRWGVRKETSNSDSPHSNRKRNLAIAAGSVVALASVAVGAHYVRKHFKVPVSQTSKNISTAKSFAEGLTQEPTSVIHAARGKNRGFGFLANGGLKDPLKEWENSGLNENHGDVFRRYGKNMEKVAVQFQDPHGRKDAAGRVIPHMVFLPKEHAKGVNDFESAKKKAWYLVKDTFNGLYDSEFDKRY